MSKKVVDPISALREKALDVVRNTDSGLVPKAGQDLYFGHDSGLKTSPLDMACLNGVLDALQLPALIISKSGTILTKNQKLSDLLDKIKPQAFGASKNQTITPLHLRELIGVDSWKYLLRNISVDAVNPTSASFIALNDVLVYSDNDASTHFDLQAIAFKLNPSKAVCFVVMFLEAQHRKELLGYNSELLHSLFDESEDLIYAFDPNGNFLAANKPLLSLMGTNLDQIRGKNRQQFFPLRDTLEFQQTDKKVIKSGKALKVIERLHAMDGVREYSSQKFPIRDTEGNIIGVGGISRDITDELSRLADLRLSESVFQRTRESIVITDLQSKIVRVNPAFEQVTGFSAETVIGRSVRLLHSGIHTDEFYAEMWRSIKETGSWSGQITNRSANGNLFVVWESISILHDESDRAIGYMAIQSDMTELLHAYDEVKRLASTDTLTGLPNRGAFLGVLNNTVRTSERNETQFCLVFLDIDHFKEINDSLGHDVGDTMLVEFGKVLKDTVRENDYVARLGGDEFVILLPDMTRANATVLAERILAKVSEIRLPKVMTDVRATASLGLAFFPDDGDTSEALMRSSDTAMYMAKRDGRNAYRFYKHMMGLESDENFNLSVELKQAVRDAQFELFAQPKFELDSMQPIGCEFLLRWQHPRLGLLEPGRFLPIAEKYNLLREIDHWVHKESVAMLGYWQRQGLWPKGWRCSMNQTAHDLTNESWDVSLKESLEAHAVKPETLVIEMTEAIWARPTDELLERIQSVRSTGVRFSIDDFGTGFSSLAYIKDLPIDEIKIDRSFISYIHERQKDRLLVEAIVELCKKLGFRTIAEGVESEEQVMVLNEIRCDAVQGFYFAKPVAVKDFQQRYLVN